MTIEPDPPNWAPATQAVLSARRHLLEVQAAVEEVLREWQTVPYPLHPQTACNRIRTALLDPHGSLATYREQVRTELLTELFEEPHD